MTPGCFKSKAASSPRTSTPLNSSANRRMSAPRPQFITPYRKQEAKREVSPLARCSSSGIPVSGSAEVQGSDVVEPSSKKPRISASSTTKVTLESWFWFFSKSWLHKASRFSFSRAGDKGKFLISTESCKFDHLGSVLDRYHISNSVNSQWKYNIIQL